MAVPGRDAQLMLLFTALFHDSGKPATTHVDRPLAGLFAQALSGRHGDRRLSCGTSAASWACGSRSCGSSAIMGGRHTFSKSQIPPMK